MNRSFSFIKFFLLVQLSINCFSSILPMKLGLGAIVSKSGQGGNVKGLNFDTEIPKLPDNTAFWADIERQYAQQRAGWVIKQQPAKPQEMGVEAKGFDEKIVAEEKPDAEEVEADAEAENNSKDAKKAKPAKAKKVADYAQQIKECLIQIYGERCLKSDHRGDILEETLTKITDDCYNKDREFKKLTLIAYFHGIDATWYDKIRTMTKKVGKGRSDTTRRSSLFFNINLGLALANRYPFGKDESIEYVMAGCMLIILLKKHVNLSITTEQAIKIIDEMWDHGGKEVSDLKMNGRTLRYLLRKKSQELNHFNPRREKNKQASAALTSVLEKMKRDFPDESEAWKDKGW